MAVIAFAYAGSALGGALAAGTAYASLAASLGQIAGSLIGNALFSKGTNTEGPRVGDLKVQASTYGTFIPVIYGTHRVSGNVIFCQGLDEHTHTQKAGKGGGATSTTYTYTTDIAILLCRGEMAGIRKIWNNGKLIYDMGAEGDPGVVITSATNARNFIFYPGDQTQMPDPTMEARKGVGNVPAYRGYCYVMFTGLECPNGQIPQLSFELVEVAETSQTVTNIDNYPSVQPNNYASGGFITSRGFLNYFAGKEAAGMPKFIYRQKGGTGYLAQQSPILIEWPSDSGIVVANSATPTHVVGSDGDMLLYMPLSTADQTSQNWMLRLYNVNSGQHRDVMRMTYAISGGSSANQIYLYAAYDSILDRYIALSDTSTNAAIIVFNSTSLVQFATKPVGAGPMAAYNGIIYVVSGGNLNLLDSSDGSLISSTTYPSNGGVGGTDYLSVIASEEGVFLLSINSANPGKIWRFESGTFIELASDINNGLVGVNYDGTKEFYANSIYAIYGPVRTATNILYRIVQFNGVDPSLRDLADVITEIHEESGFDASQVNTLEVSDQIWGFMRTRQSSGRSLLDPLLTAYSIDPVDGGSFIEYIKREAQLSIATIFFDELGASTDANTSDDPFPLAHAQQDELPRTVTTNFVNKDADYETGAEVARRNIVDTQYDDSFEMPIATDANHAATISNIILYEAWNVRNTRSTSLSRKYVYLQSSDIVSIEWPRGYYSDWRIVKLSDDGTVIRVDMVPADPELYSGEIVGTTPDGGQTVDDPPTPTNVTPLDIPILRDADNDAGEYVAMDGYGSNWPGAVLLKGDDDVNMTEEGTLTVGAPQGFTENALGSWAANIPDFFNSLTVQMTGADDSLSSVTRDAMFDSNANLFAIGSPGRWELLQAMNVTSLGGQRFTLSYFLRGQRGTEQFSGTHVAGDSIVYIDANGAGLLRPDFNLGELNTQIYYKGVTIGDNPDDVTAITETNTGVGLKPFNPVNLRSSRDGTNTTITWDRRTRLLTDSFNLVTDIPLGEASEEYNVITYTDGTFTTIVNQTRVYAPSITLSGTGTKYGAVAMVSALTGPGYYTRFTL